MALTLRIIEAPDGVEAEERRLEAGHLSLGRSRDASWALLDPRRELAGIHAGVECDAFGFVLRAAQALHLDGRMLAPGDAARIEHGAEIVLGAYRLRAAIDGASDLPVGTIGTPGGAGELAGIGGAPTISAILADVSPRGETASGPLDGRVAEEWFAETAVPRAPAPEPVAGWDGPPPTETMLPDDWNEPVGSHFADRTEHAAATSTVVQLGTVTDQRACDHQAPPMVADASAPAGAASDPVAAFLLAAGLSGGTDAPDATMRRAGALLACLLEDLAERERAAARRYEEAGVSAPPGPAVSLADLLATDRAEMMLRLRVGAARETESRFADAAARTLDWAAERSADRVAASVRDRTPLLRERNCWRAMESMFAQHADARARFVADLRRPVDADAHAEDAA